MKIRNYLKILLLLILVVSCLGCSKFKNWNYLPTSLQDRHIIYIVSHGWHTGLVLKSQTLKRRFAFITDDFHTARYYEIGWGDSGFYQANEITSAITLKALFWPSDSVLHIVALPSSPFIYFNNSEIVEVHISMQGMNNLLDFIDASFKKDFNNEVIKSQKGLYGQSQFYEGNGKFFFTNTCNNWVARGLDMAGVPIRTTLTLTANSVMKQAHEAMNRPRSNESSVK